MTQRPSAVEDAGPLSVDGASGAGFFIIVNRRRSCRRLLHGVGDAIAASMARRMPSAAFLKYRSWRIMYFEHDFLHSFRVSISKCRAWRKFRVSSARSKRRVPMPFSFDRSSAALRWAALFRELTFVISFDFVLKRSRSDFSSLGLSQSSDGRRREWYCFPLGNDKLFRPVPACNRRYHLFRRIKTTLILVLGPGISRDSGIDWPNIHRGCPEVTRAHILESRITIYIAARLSSSTSIVKIFSIFDDRARQQWHELNARVIRSGHQCSFAPQIYCAISERYSPSEWHNQVNKPEHHVIPAFLADDRNAFVWLQAIAGQHFKSSVSFGQQEFLSQIFMFTLRRSLISSYQPLH